MKLFLCMDLVCMGMVCEVFVLVDLNVFMLCLLLFIVVLCVL